MVFPFEKINRVADILFEGVLQLQDQHIPKLLLSPQQVVLGRSVSVLHPVYSQLLNAGWAPLVDIFEMENGFVSHYFAVVYVGSDGMGIGYAIDVMGMVAS